METLAPSPPTLNLPPLQDNFVTYKTVPDSLLEVPERRVFENSVLVHALGAKVVNLVERESLVEDKLSITNQYIESGEKIIDSTSIGDKLKHFRLLERPYPKLRNKVERDKKRAETYEQALIRMSGIKKEKLQDVRDDLRVLQTSYLEKEVFDKHLFISSPPYIREFYLRDVLEAQELGIEEPEMSAWLLETSEHGDERLLNFLKHHVNKVEKEQDKPELNNELMREKREWLHGVDKGVEEGWLHPSADRVYKGMQSLVTRFADHFDLETKDRGGYSLRSRKYIVLGRDVNSIRHAAKHEMNHALLGRLPDMWLDEAITEHIAQVIDGERSVDDLSHKPDQNSDHTYRSPRDVLLSLLELSDGNLKVSDITRIYSDESAPANAVNELFSNTFGEPNIDAIALLSNHIKVLSDTLKNKGYSDMNAFNEACRIANSDLRQQPHVILGETFRLQEVATS